MSDSQRFADLLVQHLPFITKMAVIYCRRDGLSPDEVDDFSSWARERLIDNDYAVLRKFRGESAFTTYLTIVLSRLYKDHRVRRRGRWRASAEAKRRGPDAVALETLVLRDRYTLEEAVGILAARGETRLSERELRELFEGIGANTRGRPTFVGDEELGKVASSRIADERIVGAEAEAHRSRVASAVRRVMDGLPAEEAVIIRMRFLEGVSVADIARARSLDQKPLYRRIDRTLQRMRGELEAAGITREDLLELLEEHEK